MGRKIISMGRSMGRRIHKHGEEDPKAWGGGSISMGRRIHKYGEEDPKAWEEDHSMGRRIHKYGEKDP